MTQISSKKQQIKSFLSTIQSQINTLRSGEHLATVSPKVQ